MLYRRLSVGCCPSSGVSPKKNAGAHTTPGVFSGGNALLYLGLPANQNAGETNPPALIGRRVGKFRITEFSTEPFHWVLWLR